MNIKKVDTYSDVYWDKAYSVDHEKIDNEHKRLFEIAREIYKYSNDSRKIISIVKELVKYTKFHFLNEENYMKSIEYKNLNEHKKIHIQIVQKLNTIIKEINNTPMEQTLFLLKKFINEDILEHILIEDKKVHHSRKTREELINSFKWTSYYKINNEIIDKEHKALFEMAAKVLDYHGTDIKTHIRLTINELYTYMKIHFEHEEEYMAKINYSELEHHKELHKKIILQMNDFIKTLPDIKIVDFERKLIEYIDIWLINHILFDDRKIIKFKSRL